MYHTVQKKFFWFKMSQLIHSAIADPLLREVKPKRWWIIDLMNSKRKPAGLKESK